MKKILFLLLIALLTNFYFSYRSNTQLIDAQTKFNKSIEVCNLSSNMLGKHACDFDSILSILKQPYKQSTIFTTDGQLVDLITGNVIPLNFSSLNQFQKDIFEKQVLLEKKKFEVKNSYFEVIETVIIFIFFILLILIILYYLLPSLWYFILRRLKEVSDAIRK
jgi:hypothetical protein